MTSTPFTTLLHILILISIHIHIHTHIQLISCQPHVNDTIIDTSNTSQHDLYHNNDNTSINTSTDTTCLYTRPSLSLAIILFGLQQCTLDSDVIHNNNIHMSMNMNDMS